MTLLYGCTEDGSLVGLGTGLLADIAASIRVGILSYYTRPITVYILFVWHCSYLVHSIEHVYLRDNTKGSKASFYVYVI